MTAAQYVRPDTSQSATLFKCRLDAMAKIFEREFGAFYCHENNVGSPTPDLSVRVTPGPIMSSGTLTEIDYQTVSGFTIPTSGQTRIDRVVQNPATGACSRVAGTAAAGSPSAAPPAIPADHLPIARITITSSDTAIRNDMIVDERTFGDLTLAAGDNLITVDGADFGGGLLRRNAGLTGAADSKQGIFSAWIRLDGGDGTNMRILQGSNALAGAVFTIFFGRTSTNKFALQARAPGGTIILSLATFGTSYVASAGIYHFLAWWDMAVPGATGILVNRVSDCEVQTYDNSDIDYTAADWAIGGTPANTLLMDGCLYEVYFAPGQWLDLSLASNRRKFISASGKPVSLGADGSLPTGSAPLVYAHLDDGELATNFGINAGGGGNFSPVGSPTHITTASTSPSD